MVGAYHVYSNLQNLPDLGPFMRFEFPTVGHVYDAQQPAAHRARPGVPAHHPVRRHPAVVRDAILATEDKRFFSHNGVDYFSIPRVIGKGEGRRLGNAAGDARRRDNRAGRSSRRAARRSRSSSCAASSSSAKRPRKTATSFGSRPPASRAVLSDWRAQRQHGDPEARRDPALAVD